jgi:hypothetical protein
MSAADIVVVANPTLLPKGISPSQKVTTKKWVDDVVLEGAPVEITRRYQASFQTSNGPSRPAALPSTSRNQYVDSEHESSDSSSEEEVRHVKSKKGAVMKKGATAVGIMAVDTDDEQDDKSKTDYKKPKPKAKVTSASSSNAMDVSSSTPTKSKIISSSGKKSSSTSSASITPAKKASNDKSKTTTAASSSKSTTSSSTSSKTPKVGRPKRAREEETDSESMEVEYRPAAKRPKKASAATSSAASKVPRSRGDGNADDDGDDVTITSITPGKSPKAKIAALHQRDDLSARVRVYLSQCTDAQKTKYRNELQSVSGVTVVRDVANATHVVYFNPPTSAKAKVSLSVLYAIAFGKWIVKQEWLDKMIEKKEIAKPDRYELTVFPGCQAARKAHMAREEYLTRQGLAHADDDFDMSLPRLIFSDLTFNLDRLRPTYSQPDLEKVESLILACAGRLGNELTSDIWITPKPDRQILSIDYGEDLGANSEDEDRLQHPEYRKRHFKYPDTQKKMPTWALEFDFLRDSVTQWKTMNMDSYKNHIVESAALTPHLRAPRATN